MQFRTIVKNPKVLEQYFSPLFLNLKEGECLEEYRQNQVVDVFLNSILTGYEVEDLQVFYEKTGVKIRHHQFNSYSDFKYYRFAGNIPEIEEVDVLLCEGDWKRWQHWIEWEKKAEQLRKKYRTKAQHQELEDLIEKEEIHEFGEFGTNEFYVMFVTKYNQKIYKLSKLFEEFAMSGLVVAVLKNYETTDLDEAITELQKMKSKELENWEKNCRHEILQELKDCRKFFEDQIVSRLNQYDEVLKDRILDRYSYD